MTNVDGWEQQPGGLWLKVAQYKNDDPEHREAAIQIMRGSIENVAQTHGAEFSEKGFRNNVRAITSGDIEVDLYLAKWEICQPKPIYLGAAFQWETYAFTPDGQLASSIYTEDVSLLKNQLRELIRSRPAGKEYPEESLVKNFERISLNQMRDDGVIYRFGEVDRLNTAMMRQLIENGALMGTGGNSAVLEYKNIPTNLMASWLHPTEPIPIMRHGVRNEKNFYVQWKEGDHDIRFLVTKGRATAIGRPRADIRPWHNGNLPEQHILESVIASALGTIKQEIDDRKWGNEPRQDIPAPQIPLHEPQSRIFKALYGAAGDEVVSGASEQPNTFDKPLSDAHVFVQNDGRMLNGFRANQARQRVFGEKPMIPGVNVLKAERQLVVLSN